MESITNDRDVIDSREVMERISELESEIEAILGEEDNEDWDSGDQQELDDLRDELAVLKKLEEEASTAPDWQYGEALIRDSHFEQYAEDMAKETSDVRSEMWDQWPFRHISWEAAAEALKGDYYPVDFEDVRYWIRV